MNKLILVGIGIAAVAVGFFATKKEKDPREDFMVDLKQQRKANDRYCFMNDCAANDYMQGANKILDDIIDRYDHRDGLRLNF